MKRADVKTETLHVWDPLVRFCHWSLVIVFVGDYFLNDEGEGWHRWLGYYAVAVVMVRGAWGFIGSPAARWSDFWPTPTRLVRHIRALVRGEDYHRMGHSPLGALVMVLMLLLMTGLGISGFLMEEVDYFWGEDLPRDLHEWMANTLFALVCVHIAAAVVESLRLRENLPLSMITGVRRKR
ncbi:cytochrome b/b6 domain-containing protein [Pseudomonas putida]|uniref:cytochrome b/b6 domain-containing protein n=1 Tax=Pseudomonas TaxID=286 RepID=UPI00190D87D9|nr:MULTISPECIES: cytochrome b/b6 domain-containing protein [Pseudomonas]EKT4485117.1 cytochrome b/b6 domain-containing protein [Pseudomonas putida]EKT4528433.1 cytochrome b/b6 domain-containing protein [Pseudomonas putida]MBK3484179.1 cytochrome b/b6 domain-containing protein [Pseudomonas fluorescens]MBO0495775.1 cytochrome b/b6 domain-containing protein [Pseudomonas sp. Marseille-Q1929]